MKDSDDEISVGIKIPVYNSENTIYETLKSLLSQTHSNYTIYIFDNCSTDSTLKIIASLNETKIKIIKSDKNNGWAWNFNRCLKDTGEEMMLFAHSDDIYHPNFLKVNIKLCRGDLDTFVFSKGFYFSNIRELNKLLKININPKQIESYGSYELLLTKIVKKGNFIFCPTAFGKSEVFANIIYNFNDREFKGSADLDAWLRVSKLKNIILIIKPIYFFHRLSKNQISYWDRKMDTSYFVKCINEHVKSLNNLVIQNELKDYIRWHEIFHAVFVNLDNINCSKQLYLNFILEVIKLNVGIHKKTKLLGLLTISFFSTFIPFKIRLKINANLLKFSR